jgi:hypothetical protein
MKTILLEIAENSYGSLLGFIQTLPKNECRVLSDNDDVLSPKESLQIQKMMLQIDQGDYSEFEDWETVKTRL